MLLLGDVSAVDAREPTPSAAGEQMLVLVGASAATVGSHARWARWWCTAAVDGVRLRRIRRVQTPRGPIGRAKRRRKGQRRGRDAPAVTQEAMSRWQARPHAPSSERPEGGKGEDAS